MKKTKSNKDLLILLKKGDVIAFDNIYEIYSKRLYGFVLRYVDGSEVHLNQYGNIKTNGTMEPGQHVNYNINNEVVSCTKGSVEKILDLMTIATPITYKVVLRKKTSDGTFSKQKVIIKKRKLNKKPNF